MTTNEDELYQKLLEHFTEGAPNYSMANEYVQAHAKLKADTILPIINSEVRQCLKRLKENIPLSSMTIEELDKANSHLDSRSQQHWSSYNKGYISLSDQVITAIKAERKRYE